MFPTNLNQTYLIKIILKLMELIYSQIQLNQSFPRL
jgi:hypothetical protein